MKILIYSANFAPEPTGIGKYSGEMAVWLVAQGHEVRVVAAPPYYPKWKIEADYAWRWYWRGEYQGAQVWRAPTPGHRDPSAGRPGPAVDQPTDSWWIAPSEPTT